MAKEDFCFTYYDGDALRDMSHMNRLERGAYNDLVLQQRKFGRLTLEQIKKILGKDFEECWPSVNLVLIFDGEKYHIEWLETSIAKMRAHSKKQSENKKGKTKAQPDNNQSTTTQQPTSNQTNPLVDVNGNEDSKNKKGDEFVPRETVEQKVEQVLSDGLNELYIDKQRPKWSHIDFEAELKGFFEKVRGSPDYYQDHDTSGIQLAFQSQLRKAKKIQPNGKQFSKNDRSEFNANELAIIQQHASGTH